MLLKLLSLELWTLNRVPLPCEMLIPTKRLGSIEKLKQLHLRVKYDKVGTFCCHPSFEMWLNSKARQVSSIRNKQEDIK